MPRVHKTKIRLCKEEGCHNSQTTAGFCRLHYLRNWKQIKTELQRKSAERLNKYVERMTREHPTRLVEEIKKDLRTRAFERGADDGAAEAAEETPSLFNDAESREEIEQLLKDLKVEKGF